MNDRCDAGDRRTCKPQLCHLFIAIFLAFLTGCSSPNQSATAPTPAFRSTNLAPGITIWTNAANESYVIEADLSKAELRSLSGTPTPSGKVGQMKFEEFWSKNKLNGNLQVLINGTFFQTYDKPTGIAFGLKQDNKLITYGYGLNEFPDQTMTVAWTGGKLAIEPYSRSTFDSATANVVGALAPTAGKNARKPLPRTFIGIKNLGADTTDDTVMIFISPGATQSEAEQTLQKFGAKRVAMLDGGASTGLIVGGKTIMQPKTRIPQTIGIFTK
jgi:hypothetical protein